MMRRSKVQSPLPHWILGYLLVLGMFLSCNSHEDESFVIDTASDISLKDLQGNDLLNPNELNAYNHEDIKLFYILDGRELEVFDSNLDQPKGFFIYNQGAEYRMTVFPNVDKNEEYPETIIQWTENDQDTVKCSIERGPNMEVCRQVWLNEKLVWESYDKERLLRIAK